MLWYVFGATSKEGIHNAHLVEAETSDEALKKGQELDPAVCATQVYKPEFAQFYPGLKNIFRK